LLNSPENNIPIKLLVKDFSQPIATDRAEKPAKINRAANSSKAAAEKLVPGCRNRPGADAQKIRNNILLSQKPYNPAVRVYDGNSMKLPNELTEDKAASFALSWSLTWRFLVLFFTIGTAFQFAPTEFRIEYAIPLAIASIVVTFLCFWLWVHSLLRKGIGRVKIIFMENKHYEELKNSVNESNKL
jgi:hypothetical protein